MDTPGSQARQLVENSPLALLGHGLVAGTQLDQREVVMQIHRDTTGYVRDSRVGDGIDREVKLKRSRGEERRRRSLDDRRGLAVGL